MPTDYVAEAKDAAIIGVIASVILLVVNGAITWITSGTLAISTDILGVYYAIVAGNYAAALGLAGGIFMLGVAIKLIPWVRGYVGV